ncbi:pentatricopeptide repeat-containing protein chloroplastic [Dorcoceras hygrometricum]|uniref:Pentatricopeptide repeat-containing protein chloroplastic n=1 Tax=Dorcoceras hygrometricum TaxID=472368 RepID=A0A2Z7ATL2_9LAMI|nr:pentatricopeptide repeat-containing protein chloroplastic [Dorcoceras hygrometricum]
MATAKFPDSFSIPSYFSCNSRKAIQHIPNSLISIFFLNLNTRNTRPNSSTCSSPLVLKEDESTYYENVPVIHRRIGDLALSNCEDSVNVPNDSKEWNSLICGLCNDPQTQQLAFQYYEKAKAKTEFRPQKYTLNLLARYLIRSKNWSLLFTFFEDFKKFKVIPGKSTCCTLVGSCIKARKFRLVNVLLEIFLAEDVKVAVSAFDSAMKGYNQLHMYSSTAVLYQRMRSGEVSLDAACYCRIMDAHLKMGHYEKAIEMFQEIGNRKMVRIGDTPSPFSSRIYWILCEALGKLGRCFEALEFFREMQNKGIPEDQLIYSSLICSFASVGEVKLAEELMEEAESKNLLRDPALFLKLVLRYVEEGLVTKTVEIVATMKRVNVRVSDCIFCAIVNGFSKKRGLKEAIRVYEDLVSRGCDPGQVTYASILNIYCRLGLYSHAETLFSEMERKGFDSCVVAYSSMVAAYGKMGRIRDATKLVAKMKVKGIEPNVWTYNSLLDMHGKVLNLRVIEKTWKEMKRRRVSPDKVSYTTVIGAYNRAKELETCIKYYQEFRLNGGTMDRAMAGIMVAVLSKMNRVDELVEMLQDIKKQGTRLDARFYHSAMNALRDAGLQVQVTQLQESFKVF